MDPLRTKAEPVSDEGRAPVNLFRRGKNLVQLQPEGSENTCEKQLQAPRSVNKEQKVLQVPKQRLPCGPGEDPGEAGGAAAGHRG